MESDQAKELLSFHSCRNNDIHNPKWSEGFLGSLRPFRGELREENLIEVMECLKALKEEFLAPAVDREIVSEVVGIVHLTSAWASPDGMLGSNRLLTEAQTRRLLAWADIVEGCFLYLLEGAEEEAFADYQDYLEGAYC